MPGGGRGHEAGKAVERNGVLARRRAEGGASKRWRGINEVDRKGIAQYRTEEGRMGEEIVGM